MSATIEGHGAKPGIPLEEASTVPAPWYWDAAHYAREVRAIFGATWQQVAREDQLGKPGEYVTAEIAGEPVLIARGRDGVLRAFSNVCRHRAGAVATGDGCSKAFSCTYHGWTYGLDGALLAAPEMEGVRDFDRARFGLPEFRCETWSGLVFVNLDPRGRPLAESLGRTVELAAATSFSKMTFARRDPYVIACNWKTYVDNYLEGYHVPRAHPGLNKVLDYKRYTVAPEGPIVTQVSPERAKPGARPGNHDAKGFLYVWVWPNFMLNVSPGYAQTNVILPLAPEKTLCLFDYWFLAKGGPNSGERKKLVAWSDGIQKEDVWICESVQRNLHSHTYLSGRYSAKRENGLYHFHERLRRAMA